MTYPEPIEQVPKISEALQQQPNRLLEEVSKTNFVIPRLIEATAGGNLSVIELHSDKDNQDRKASADTTGNNAPVPNNQFEAATVAGLAAGAINAIVHQQAAVAGEIAATGVKAALANFGPVIGSFAGAAAGAATGASPAKDGDSAAYQKQVSKPDSDEKKNPLGAVERIITGERTSVVFQDAFADKEHLNLPNKEAIRIKALAKVHAAQIAKGVIRTDQILELEKSFGQIQHTTGVTGVRRLVSEINKELSILDWTGQTRLTTVPTMWAFNIWQSGHRTGCLYPGQAK